MGTLVTPNVASFHHELQAVGECQQLCTAVIEKLIVSKLLKKSHVFCVEPEGLLQCSRWLLTAATRVRAQVESCGIVVDQVVLEQVFSENSGFSCQ
jgi:hypothetical protein